MTPEKNPFVFWLPAVQENKLSVTKAKRAVVNNHCFLCLSPLYRFAFFFILSSSSVSCSAAVYVSTNILAPVSCCPPLTWLILIEARTRTRSISDPQKRPHQILTCITLAGTSGVMPLPLLKGRLCSRTGNRIRYKNF